MGLDSQCPAFGLSWDARGLLCSRPCVIRVSFRSKSFEVWSLDPSLDPPTPHSQGRTLFSYSLLHCLSNDHYTICLLKTSRHLQFYSRTLAKSTRIDEQLKKIKLKKDVSTTRGVPRRSPIQVLTTPDVAWLQWSDENWYFQRGMNADKRGAF